MRCIAARPSDDLKRLGLGEALRQGVRKPDMRSFKEPAAADPIPLFVDGSVTPRRPDQSLRASRAKIARMGHDRDARP